MPRIAHLTADNIAHIEKALGIKIPAVYSQFMTEYPFPDLTYMRAADLIELHEVNAALIIQVNENLRDPTFNPFPWKEHYFSVGERAGDEAVFYLDLSLTPALSLRERETCPVFALAPGAEVGERVADDFALWADGLVQALAKTDRDCMAWHALRKAGPWWKFWNRN